MISIRNASKIYPPANDAGTPIRALDGVDLNVPAGDAVALMGASGSGKSTLLHLIGALDAPSGGEIRVDGKALHQLNDTELSRFRRERLGFIFQFFHLMPSLSVLENVLLPVRLARLPEEEFRARARDLIGRVGLSGREESPPDALSGGQQQRVALARALVTKPAVLLADEPTGNLDSANSTAVLELITQLVRENGTTLVMATHSDDAARICGRIVRMKDGRVTND